MGPQTSDHPEEAAGRAGSRNTGAPGSPDRRVLPSLALVLAIAVVAILVAAGFMVLFSRLDRLVWAGGGLASSHPWAVPGLVLLFSLLVGLSQRYLGAPTVIGGGFVEAIRGDGAPADHRLFPGTLVSSLCSLLSGASIGPEGALAVLVGQVSSFVRNRLQVPEGDAFGFDLAALASAFNGIIGSVLFTGVLATELQPGSRRHGLEFLVWNLLAGAVGFVIFSLLGFPPFARSIPFPSLGELHLAFVPAAVGCGVIGALLAIGTGACLRSTGVAMERLFGDRVVLRALAAGLIVATIGTFFPDLLFSGEAQIHGIIADPARIGVVMLLLMAVLKVLLLGVSFKGGFIGGPLFPILFSATLVGLAFSLVFPGIPLPLFVLCIQAAAIAVALGAPLTAILLVVVVSPADQETIVLLVISVATALLLANEVGRRLGHDGETGGEAGVNAGRYP